ncbi:MAG: penicillin-binding protein activator [Myxococcota bacterium]
MRRHDISVGVSSARAIRSVALLLFVLMSASSLFACHKSHRRDGDDLSEKPPIEAKDEGAQKKFDEARQLLEDGEYRRAAEQFRLLQADHADDPIAHVAELYAARAALGDLSPGRFASSTTPPEGLAGAIRRLEALANDGSVDDRVSFSARAYLATAHVLAADQQAAYSVLETYSGPSLSSVVLAADQPVALLLIAESMRDAGRYESAVQAYANLYDIYQEYRPSPEDAGGLTDAGAEQSDSRELFDDEDLAQLGKWVDLARSYAFELSEEQIDEADLQEYVTTDTPFLRAVGGWGLLRATLEDGIESDEARAAIEDLFNRVSPDMVAVGAGPRAAELSTQLAAAGGPRRLAIGVVLPLSGKAAGVGAKVMAGALTAIRAYDAADEPSVTLVFQDSAQPAADVFAEFSKQGVAAVVGPLDRKRAVDFAAEAEKSGVPLMTMTAQSARELMRQAKGEVRDEAADASDSADADAAPRSFVFRNFVDPRAEARAAARLAFEDAGDRKAAIIYPGIGYGRIMAEEFRKEFSSHGGQIVAQIEYDRTSSDFASIAKRLAASDAEAVFVPDSASKVAELTAFFANANIWGYAIGEEPPNRSKRKHVHYLGTSLWQDPMLIRQARSYVDGAAVPSWFSATFDSGRVTRFVRRFEAIHGRVPDNFEAFAYDSVSWFVTLMLERGMSRPEALRDALLSTPQFEGVTGAARFESDGEAVRELRFVTPGDEGFAALPFTARTETVADDANEDVEPVDTPESADETEGTEIPTQ